MIHLKVKTLNGKSWDWEAVWRTTSDRVAFERRYELNASIIGQYFEKDGKPKKDIGGFRDEWMAFLVWRSLRRHDPTVGEFDDFIETIETIEFGDGAEEADVDPTKESDDSNQIPSEQPAHLAQVAQLG